MVYLLITPVYIYQSCNKVLCVFCTVSPVEEVDGVTPVVLNVPAEWGETHAYIEPGHLHARDVHIDVGEDWLLQHWHVIQVPAGVGILLTREEKSA